jgi:solute carrier family 25 citrate transporter 1
MAQEPRLHSILSFFNSKEKKRTHTFLAGLGAGICEAILVVTPAETLKVKLIHDRLSEAPKYKGLVDGVS